MKLTIPRLRIQRLRTWKRGQWSKTTKLTPRFSVLWRTTAEFKACLQKQLLKELLKLLFKILSYFGNSKQRFKGAVGNFLYVFFITLKNPGK